MVTADAQPEVVTEYGIEFIHNDYYSKDELTDAVRVVDEYYEMALDCALDTYPALADAILSLPADDLKVVVNFPDMYDSLTGREAFSCQFSEKGCAGTYSMSKREIRITPSLDALGHEMSHWMNHMLFGKTNDNDPEDLSEICQYPLICHLYAESRNLISCRD